MSNFNKLYKYADSFLKLAQMPQPEPLGKDKNKGASFSQVEYPLVLFNSGLSPWKKAPSGETLYPPIDAGATAFTKYINPALDSLGIENKVNITFSIGPNKNVIIEVDGDPAAEKIQNILQRTWGVAMTQAFMKASILAPTAKLFVGRIKDYG